MMFDDGAGEEALAYRKKYRGVIGITSKIPIKDASILSLVYTPGVEGYSSWGWRYLFVSDFLGGPSSPNASKAPSNMG